MNRQLRASRPQRGPRQPRRPQNVQRSPRVHRPNYRQQSSRRNPGGSTLHSTSFTGGIDELKSHYYDCSSYKQADRYVTTTKAIKEYVGKNYSNGGDIRATLENMEEFEVENPEDPSANYNDIIDPNNGEVIQTAQDQVTYLERKIYDNEIIAMVKRRNLLKSNLQKAYSLILGQCTDLMKDKLKASTRWNDIKSRQDALELLNEIRTITYKFEEQKYLPLSIHNAKATFYSFCQGNLTNSDYFQRSKTTLT